MSGEVSNALAGDGFVSEKNYAAIRDFVYCEARLADESRYSDWEALWDDDGTYWVPVGQDDYDPTKRMSVIYDNRARLGNRIKQLETGKRFAQVPASIMRRMISNIEVADTGGGEFTVGANFLLYEMAIQSNREVRLWGGRLTYKLRRRDGALRIFHKKVQLVNSSEPLANLPFLI